MTPKEEEGENLKSRAFGKPGLRALRGDRWSDDDVLRHHKARTYLFLY